MRVDGFASGCVSNTKSGQVGHTRFPLLALHQQFGLVRLTARNRQFSVGDNVSSFSESWMR
jgi:hypothetical protein